LRFAAYIATNLFALNRILVAAAELNNELHAYDPLSMTWFDLSSYFQAGTPPTARNGHGFTSAGGKLYVHGGQDANGNGSSLLSLQSTEISAVQPFVPFPTIKSVHCSKWIPVIN
jgi:hypothetical protein